MGWVIVSLPGNDAINLKYLVVFFLGCANFGPAAAAPAGPTPTALYHVHVTYMTDYLGISKSPG